MTITFLGTDYVLPSTLSDMTLGTFIEWTTTYGKTFSAREREIEELDPEDPLEAVERALFLMDRARTAVAFWTGIPIETVSSDMEIGQLLTAYAASSLAIAIEERDLVVQAVYDWNDQEWTIYPPAVVEGEELSHDQFNVLLRLAGYLLDLSDGDFSVLPYLCAFYLRPTADTTPNWGALDDTALVSGMLDLPMDIALSVAVYIKESAVIFAQLVDQHVNQQTV